MFSKVHFVAGKGGVGKTLIAQALATFFSTSHQTLLIELSEEETGEERPRLASIKTISKNLYYVKIFPDQALYEYLMLKIPTKKMLDSMLAHSLFRMLCSAMPGLFDLTRLGKIWYHADEINGSRQQIFEKIVVDMPSSGFVSRFLSIASVVSDAVKIGPLAKEAILIKDYFAKRENACLHLVAMPQELVVNETLELAKQIKKNKHVHLGMLFINRVLRLKSESYLPIPSQFLKSAPNIANIVNAFDARISDESAQRNRFLENGLSMPQILIADQVGEMVESKIVDEIVKILQNRFVL